MALRLAVKALLVLLPLALAHGARAAPAAPPNAKQSAAPSKPESATPLPAGEKAAWSHAPFEAGDCSICHQKNDPKAPGPLVKAGNELCYSCHEELASIMERKFKHPPAVQNCVNCHNPHNAREKKLLVAEMGTLCLRCHEKVKSVAELVDKLVNEAKVL